LRFGHLFGTITGSYIESLNANRGYEASQYNTGKANHHGKKSRYEMLRRQIAITDSETGHQAEIQGVADPPPLYSYCVRKLPALA
jgi:hypothetical protein